MKTLRVPNGLVGELSRFLRSDGELTQEVLLPELKEVVCPTRGGAGGAFGPFIDARNAARYPVRLVRKDFPVNPPANLVEFPPSSIPLLVRLGRLTRLIP